MSITTTNKYGFVNPTHEKNAKRPDNYTAKEWDEAIYGAYIGLVNLVKDKITMKQYLSRNEALFNSCGMPADGKHLLDMLTSLVTVKREVAGGPKMKWVSRKYQVAAFFNGGWMELEEMDVHSEQVKEPAEKKPSKPRTKKVTEDDAKLYFSKLSQDEKRRYVSLLLGEIAA